MQNDPRLQGPVVPSAFRATQEAEWWTSLHDYRRLTDAAGLDWQLHATEQQKPDPEDHRVLLWGLSISLTCHVTAATLAQTGTLDPVADERLVGLLGDASIPMEMRPRLLWGREPSEIHADLKVYLPQLRRQIKTSELHQVKRQLAEKWTECLTSFAHAR